MTGLFSEWFIGSFPLKMKVLEIQAINVAKTFNHGGHLISPKSRGFLGGLIGCCTNVLRSWLRAVTKLKTLHPFQALFLSVNQMIYDFSFHLQGVSGTYANLKQITHQIK